MSLPSWCTGQRTREDTVNPHYPPSRFAIFCYSDSQILIPQNLLSATSPCYSNSGSDKISYPQLVRIPISYLFNWTLSPTFTYHQRTMTQSLLSYISHLTLLVFFTSIRKYNKYLLTHSFLTIRSFVGLTLCTNHCTIYLYCCTVHLVDSLIITQPTNALIVCHLFLNNFLKHFHCSYMFR